MKALPRVVLVGRVNVGKSTLFNRLSSNVKAIVHDVAGVTRDPLYDTCSWQGYDFLIVDTGGAQYHSSDPLQHHVFEKSVHEIEQASIIVLVVDGKDGFSKDDYRLIQDVRKRDIPFIAVINKSEVAGSDDIFYEAEGLGFDRVVKVSAAHGRGIEDLLEAIIQLHQYDAVRKKMRSCEAEKPAFQVALLGRPNVGKSSLMNLLVKSERSLVSDIPGTTREALIDHISFFQTTIQVVDTAGVRRSRSVHESLEELMVSNTMHALKGAQLVILVFNSTEEHIFDQDIKLAYYAFQHLYKGVIVVWNKTDLVDEPMDERIKRLTRGNEHLFSKLPFMALSCMTQKNVNRLVPQLHVLWKRYSQQIPAEIQEIFLKRLEKTPLMHKRERLVLYRAYQIQSAPPTIMLEVNEPLWFGDSQRAFFENILREQYDLLGVPVKWVIRKK